LLARDRYTSAPYGDACLVPSVWTRFYSAGGGGFQSFGTAFLHERTAPNGTRRLVAVDLPPMHAMRAPLTIRLFTVGSLLRPPTELRTSSRGSLPTYRAAVLGRVYAGQPDPNDPSHFTIEYEVDDHPRILDGWLRDDDTVVIESRD
jgi:hypothetical protein